MRSCARPYGYGKQLCWWEGKVKNTMKNTQEIYTVYPHKVVVVYAPFKDYPRLEALRWQSTTTRKVRSWMLLSSFNAIFHNVTHEKIIVLIMFPTSLRMLIFTGHRICNESLFNASRITCITPVFQTGIKKSHFYHYSRLQSSCTGYAH